MPQLNDFSWFNSSFFLFLLILLSWFKFFCAMSFQFFLNCFKLKKFSFSLTF